MSATGLERGVGPASERPNPARSAGNRLQGFTRFDRWGGENPHGSIVDKSPNLVSRICRLWQAGRSVKYGIPELQGLVVLAEPGSCKQPTIPVRVKANSGGVCR